LQRILSTAVLVGLLVATAAAFAITERLKLTKSPITGTKVRRDYLSPAARTTAAIEVRLLRPDRVTATIQSGGGSEVDTLAYAQPLRRGWHTFTWDGRDDTGTEAKDGTYRLEVHFVNQHRTILLPNALHLTTKVPQVLTAAAVRPEFSPDGDHQSDTVTIRYALDQGAHVAVFLGGQRILFTRAHKAKGKVSWGGVVGVRLLPPGTYTLEVGAVDLAGNRTPPADRKAVVVVLRYIALAEQRVVAAPGARFAVAVSTDAKRYRWKLGARSGTASGKILRLRAPRARGRYVLVVTEHGHSARATVVVR
jgi:hypothetical protein